FDLGRAEEALHLVERAESAQSVVAPAWRSPTPRFVLGYLRVEQGRIEEGREHLEAIARAHPQHPGAFGDHMTYIAQCVLAECDLLDGRPQAARERLEPLLQRARDETNKRAFQMLTWLALAHLELGDEAQAEAMVVEGMWRMKADVGGTALN